MNLLFTWSTIWKKILKQVDVKKPKQLREIMTTQRVGNSPWIAHGMWTYIGWVYQSDHQNKQSVRYNLLHISIYELPSKYYLFISWHGILSSVYLAV